MGNTQSQEGYHGSKHGSKPSTVSSPPQSSSGEVASSSRAQSLISIAPEEVELEEHEPTSPTDAVEGDDSQQSKSKKKTQTSAKKTHVPYNGPRVPTVIQWRGNGNNVYVTGTFSRWKKKVQLLKEDNFTVLLQLRPCTQRFKFLVDGVWRCSPDFPTATDAEGNLYNYLEIDANDITEMNIDRPDDKVNGRESVERDEEAEQYVSEIPAFLSNNALGDTKLPSPPSLPPHLEKCVLNSNTAYKEDQSVLPNPNHVVLNHLAAANLQMGVLALSATTRYHRKYVTTAVFKPFEP
ncbi:AMP-activated protein kinase beta subunit [Schizosaccharomyces japonicus yFS275]|uniref:AMP-activated protein kinase beta subunit n=1 Tax=Schizosaccharomyces japonicus (strain yFS275 / FY16936) TaxID=402676 RepID=B6K536_SCHJY|nr:AMP-activated protein kinase beta subunit [Schizosaccharomyces japonicus yFS275]EEB08640.1 AMP-activated protein kinase beta subunit [Schizosaccharomyces japonicus yFS275]